MSAQEELPWPADPVGTRPPGEPRHDTLELVWYGLVATRYHFGPLAKMTFYAGAIYLLAGVLLCCPYNYFRAGLPWWAGFLTSPLYLPLAVPLFTGYAYAFLLEFRGMRPRARVLFRAFAERRLYLNVLVAGGVPYLASCAVDVLAALLFPGFREPLSLGVPLGTMVASMIPGALAQLAVIPLVFGPIDALVADHACQVALRRSVGFLFKHSRLFAGFILVALVEAGMLNALVFAFLYYAGMPDADTQGVGQPCVGFLMALLPIGFGILAIIVGTAICVLFYREFVWREREAEAPPPAA